MQPRHVATLNPKNRTFDCTQGNLKLSSDLICLNIFSWRAHHLHQACSDLCFELLTTGLWLRTVLENPIPSDVISIVRIQTMKDIDTKSCSIFGPRKIKQNQERMTICKVGEFTSHLPCFRNLTNLKCSGNRGVFGCWITIWIDAPWPVNLTAVRLICGPGCIILCCHKKPYSW